MRMSDPHEFCEDVNDYSMCMCGIAAGPHDAVMLNITSKAPSSPVETTDGETGTELRPCDSETLDDLTAWALAVKDSYIAHLTADLAELRGSMQAADDRRSL
jgi:hypothetical protein